MINGPRTTRLAVRLQPRTRSAIVPRMGDQARPTVVDLFSGAGGLSLGFEAAGFDVLAAVEYDPVHAAVHRYNFPLTEVLCADVRSLSAEDVLSSAKLGWEAHHPGALWSGRVDVVVGGPSCQGFSVIGNMSGDDERNELVMHFARLVDEIQPAAFCMENVPGLLHPKYESLRGMVFDRLEGAGYAIAGKDRVVRAEELGVPQRRHRVVVLGVKKPFTALPVQPVEAPTATVKDAFAGLPVLDPALVNKRGERMLTSAEVAALDTADSQLVRHAGVRSSRPGEYGHRRVVDSASLSGLAMTLHSITSATRFAATVPGKKEPVSRYIRLAIDQPALTLRAGTGRERGSFSAPRPIHPDEPRVITVREAARLHSFPDWFRFHVTNWHAHRQIGNSVPPLLARAAAGTVMMMLGREPQESEREPIQLGDESLLSLTVTSATKVMGAINAHVPAPRTRKPVVLVDENQTVVAPI